VEPADRVFRVDEDKGCRFLRKLGNDLATPQDITSQEAVNFVQKYLILLDLRFLGDGYKEYYLLRCGALLYDESSPTFRNNVLPPSSG
jgi:hypothetical protein